MLGCGSGFWLDGPGYGPRVFRPCTRSGQLLQCALTATIKDGAGAGCVETDVSSWSCKHEQKTACSAVRPELAARRWIDNVLCAAERRVNLLFLDGGVQPNLFFALVTGRVHMAHIVPPPPPVPP